MLCGPDESAEKSTIACMRWIGTDRTQFLNERQQRKCHLMIACRDFGGSVSVPVIVGYLLIFSICEQTFKD